MAGPPFRTVCFDCDSTLTAIEGVDELLRFAPPERRQEVAALTTAAMEGRLPLADVYATRLRLLAPRREQLVPIGALYTARALPDARDVVQALQHLGVQVHIVSGGLLPPVLHLAQFLGVPATCVHAVDLAFHADGSYRDFDRGSPLWRNGGKVEVVQALPAAARPVAFVGDGATDLETQGHVDRFVGFGGVAVRPLVRDRAEHFVDAPRLAAVLPLLLDADQQARLRALPAFAALLSPPAPRC